MTTPKITTFYQGGSRWYEHPETGDKVPGVTSVLSMLAKPFLQQWAAKEVAQTAVREIEAVTLLAASDPDGAVDYLKAAPRRNTRAAADAGTAAHAAFEAMGWGGPMPKPSSPAYLFARQFQDYLDTVQPKLIAAEETVWSDKHQYAGSFDGLIEVDGQRAWLDYKTTRSGVYAETALQLAAYSHAEYLLDSEGETTTNYKGSRGLVLHVRPEKWGLYEVPVDDDVFEYFLALRTIFDWSKASRGVPGRPKVKGAVKIEEGRA